MNKYLISYIDSNGNKAIKISIAPNILVAFEIFDYRSYNYLISIRRLKSNRLLVLKKIKKWK